MSFRGELDRVASVRLRRLLAGETRLSGRNHHDREELAAYALSYMQSFIEAYLCRRRFGFSEPFPVVARSVADLEVSLLLAPPSAAPARSDGREPCGCPRLAGLLARTPVARAAARPPVELSDRDLLDAFRQLLRKRANQGCYSYWKEQHPEEARLLRNLKRACRAHPRLRILHDARGQLLACREWDPRLPRLPDQEITLALAGIGRITAARVLAAMEEALAPAGPGRAAGRSCFLMDVVRSAHAVVGALLASEPAPGERPGTIDGVPVALIAEKMERSLRACALEILSKQRKRASGWEHDAWAEVSVELLLEGYRVRPKDKRSLRDRLRTRLGPLWSEERAGFQCERATYLMRLLRRAWEGTDGSAAGHRDHDRRRRPDDHRRQTFDGEAAP